ncbi:MAG: aspartyl-tRNA(Asn)/glutamyl-tRNA(Gln) amidotransferase subunit [Acidimicrobiaceae bacterium]|nr:aspartyl-tRNA(Asn)/glutamyl-tRNA(Gln) amidotransferase subunit [Acidimicrobiaceae bacterium]
MTIDGERGADAVAIAERVRTGRIAATDIALHALAAIKSGDAEINSFTSVLTDRALLEAGRVDASVAAGRDPGPLAGVPFAVKNLFDVVGEVTLAGSRINADDPPATADAVAVARLTEAGAVLVGSLNMDEYAYGFTTENSHYGPCRNPHDPDRVAGGSSGGSGAAVAADFVPFTLGSDTNGSVRVPATLCGVFGLKPTYGRISRRGMFPFCPSLDHVGVLTRSVRDLAVTFDVLQGHDPDDPVSVDRSAQMTASLLDHGIGDLRLGVADGYFARGGTPEVLEAVAVMVEALGIDRRVTIAEAGRARSAAMVITACEGAQLHLDDLRGRAEDFDPMTRDRFLAGALVPASAYLVAQRFRQWFRVEVNRALASVDVFLAPATPFPAPLIGQREAVVDGETVLTQPYLGCYTQPLSFVGLPVVSIPVRGASGLPVGVQLVAAPYREAALLRVAAELERRGLCRVPEVARRWT